MLGRNQCCAHGTADKIKSPSIIASCSIHVGRERVNYRPVSSVLIEHFFMVTGNKWQQQGDEYKISGKWTSNSSHVQQWQMTSFLRECTLQAGECTRCIPSSFTSEEKGTNACKRWSPFGNCSQSLPFRPLNREAQVFVFSSYSRNAWESNLHQTGLKEDVNLNKDPT